MTHLLKVHPLKICLTLALLQIGLFGTYLFSENDMPFGDGQHYVSRAFMLYGFFHKGQWGDFWYLFTSPQQSIAPPHFLLFFLVPKIWAGLTSYILLQMVTTYFLLAFSLWKICSLLERPEWAPSLYLVCAIQNFSLDYAYAFHLDMVFLAVACLAFAEQMQAWKFPDFRQSLLSGLGVSLLFWVKPANALLFLFFYLSAELFYGFFLRKNTDETGKKNFHFSSLFQHSKGVFLGFVPMLLLTLFCGAGNSILLLISNNELHPDMSPVYAATDLGRFFYFPLSFCYFYDISLLGCLFLVGYFYDFFKSKPEPQNYFPGHLLLAFLFAALLLGEIFSFLLYSKTMRSMMILLPILWLGLFWSLEKWNVQVRTSFMVLVAYSSLAFS